MKPEKLTVSGRTVMLVPTSKSFIGESTCIGCCFYLGHLGSYASDGTEKNSEPDTHANCFTSGRASVCQDRGTDKVYVEARRYRRYITALAARRILGE